LQQQIERIAGNLCQKHLPSIDVWHG